MATGYPTRRPAVKRLRPRADKPGQGARRVHRGVSAELVSFERVGGTRGRHGRALRGVPGVVAAVFLLVLWQAGACASDLARRDGRLQLPEAGVGLADPALGSDFAPAALDGALAAWRSPDGASLALFSDCARGDAPLRWAANQLLLGLVDVEIATSREVEAGGEAGWLQDARATLEGRRVRIRSLTTRRGDCLLDLVLVDPGATPARADAFDGWWAGLTRVEP